MEAISPPIQALLDIFATSLADVRFADVDARALAALAAQVTSAAGTVATAQAALEGALEALQREQDTLLQQAQRALAYARVFAENDEALSAQLEAITLPRGARRGRNEALVLSPEPQAVARPRGRPRKSVALVETQVLEGMEASAE